MSLPFFPPSLSTCILWLDASDPTSITVSSGRITSWSDKSQFSNNTTVVSPEAPLLSNINNLSSIFFQGNAGSAQYFQGPLSSFSSIYDPSRPVLSVYITMFAVGTLSTTSVSGFFPNFIGAGFRSNYYPGTQIVQWSTTEANISVFPHATSNSNYATLPGFNQQFIVTNSAFYNASTSYSYMNVNGYPQTRSDGANIIDSSVLSTIGVYSIGGSLSTSTDFRNSWTGHIAEVILYATSNQLTWNQRQLVEGYLASKWGVQNSLPPYHPYKNIAISLSTPTSALYISNSNQSKSVIFPSTNTLSTQILWTMPQSQEASMSTVAYVPSYKESFDSNGSVVLNQNTQSALLVNNPNGSNWLVHSLATNNLLYAAQNVSLIPYIQYPKARKSGAPTAVGTDVAISSNGNYIVAGDRSVDTPFTNAGGLYMFIQNPSTGLYSTFQTLISPSTTQGSAEFGQKVAISDDGTYIAGSSSNFNSPTFSDIGYVSIFKKSATTDFWTFTQQLNPPISAYKTLLSFGKSLEMSSNGDYIFVGAQTNYTGIVSAGAVYPFKKTAGTDFWTQLSTIFPPVTVLSNSGFGGSISITPDAGFLIIGASNYRYNSLYVGTLFFYTKDLLTDNWSFKQQITPSDYSQGIVSFSYSTALARNSNYFVATTREGNNYVYKKNVTTDLWNLSYILHPYTKYPITFFGKESSISENGDYILISGEGSSATSNIGGCVMYQKQTATDLWQTTNYFYASDVDRFGFFGRSMSMVPTAERFVVGNPGSASLIDCIYVFKQSSIGVTTASNTFLLVNTSSPTKTILLPHPSSNKGQMIFIKDANQKAFYSPIRISTMDNSFINSTFSNFSFFENNACLQLQSDGISQYNIVNYFSGTAGTQPNIYNFQSFWIKGSRAGAVSNYPIPIRVTYDGTHNVNNYFFLDSDNVGQLPFWNETGGSNVNSSNIFWVNIPYIPPSPMARQYFLYWNCNSLYYSNPSNVFTFFDDFSGPTSSPPNSNNWYVTKQGSVNAQAFLNGFTDSVTLTGVNNTSANGGILSRNTFLSTNFSICFSAQLSATTFATVAFATTSTLQFLPTGEQLNWWWTTLGNGHTLSFSNLTRRFCFSQAENAAQTILGCNTGAWNQTTTYDYEFTYTSNGGIGFFSNAARRGTRTSLFSFTDITYLNSNKYIFFGQGSISNLAAQSFFLNNVFIRNYVSPEPFFSDYGTLNTL